MNEYQDQDMWFEVQGAHKDFNRWMTVGDYDTREQAEIAMSQMDTRTEYRVIKVWGRS